MIRTACIAAIVALAPSAAVRAQGTITPTTVTAAFDKRFPGAHSVSWSASGRASYQALFSRNGANIKSIFTPNGTWIETSTEIGAITLPVPVRTAVLRDYKGFQFTDTRRIDRPLAPSPLFEVQLSKPGDIETVQFESTGKLFHLRSDVKVAPPLVVAGTWRGESLCLPGHPACHDETVIYHFTRLAADSMAFDVQANRVVGGQEVDTGTLPCTLDGRLAALYCTMTQGTWQFQVRGDSIVGGLVLTDGSQVRRVAVHRDSGPR